MFVQRHCACFLSDVLIFWSNETLPVLVGVDMFDTDFLAVIFIGGFFFFFACYGLWVVFACLFSCWQTAVVVRLPHWAQTKAKHAAVIIGRESAQNTQSSSYIALSSYCLSVFARWNQLSAFHKSMCWHKGPRTSQEKLRLHFSGSDTVTCSALFG